MHSRNSSKISEAEYAQHKMQSLLRLSQTSEASSLQVTPDDTESSLDAEVAQAATNGPYSSMIAAKLFATSQSLKAPTNTQLNLAAKG